MAMKKQPKPQGNLTTNASQPSGKSIGDTESPPIPVPSMFSKGHSAGGAGILKIPAGGKADCFRGTTKSGLLRLSGHSGAHRLGKKK